MKKTGEVGIQEKEWLITRESEHSSERDRETETER